MRACYYYQQWFFVIFAIPSYCGNGYGDSDGHQSNGNGAPFLGIFDRPFFDQERNHPNISAHVNSYAYLPCYVKQLGNKSVSWIRKADSHILAVDRYTFIADERFQVIAAPPGESWVLQIKYVQPRDGGIYECQISTEPKLAFPFHLTVLVPTIRLEPQESPHIWEGSQIQLKCIVQDALPDNLGKISWLHNNMPLNKNDFKSSIIFQSKIEGEMIVETATFRSVTRSLSGNWTCALLDLKSTASIVVTGEGVRMELNSGMASSSCSLILSLSSTYQKMEAFLLIFLLAITSWNYNS